MKKRLLALTMIVIMAVCCTSCTKLGKWVITEVSAGDVVMTETDIDSMGLDAGFVKLNKSGSCVVNLLGDEYDGSWTEGEDGSMVLEYGDGMTGSATIEGDMMTFTDAQGAVYKLKK